MKQSSFPLFLAKALFVFLVGSSCESCFLLCKSLSLDDSLSSSPKRWRTLQRINEQIMPGIWKLTTDALPYELDIRSKLTRSFSGGDNAVTTNNKENENDDNPNGETILLKMNPDGTFKQCDEGYREGRWVTGRWKLQLLDTSTESDDGNTDTPKPEKDSNREKLLLLLAMNRQYFGPPYDVLLEATNTIACNEDAQQSSEEQNQPDSEPADSSLKHWQGVVRKGKFLRPAPGKHPLDSDDHTRRRSESILLDPEFLGKFSLERALAATAIDRRRRKTNGNEKSSNDSVVADEADESEDKTIVSQNDENDGTFFFPCSSSDDGGVLQ